MTRLLLIAVAGGLLLTGDLRAQPPAPRPLTGVNTPPVSPYLNLLRPGTNPGANYYGIVRPEVAFFGAIQGLQGQVWQTQQALNQQAAWDTTGHPAAFLNYGGYFLTTGASNQAAARGGPTVPARPTLGGGFGQAPGRSGLGR